MSSVDYCSLLEATPLPSDFGMIELAPRRFLDFCQFRIGTNEDGVEVRVGYLNDSGTLGRIEHNEDRSRTLPRGLTIHRGPEGGGGCHRFLRFTDDIWLNVTAFRDSGMGDSCRIADATVDGVVRRAMAQQAKHFSFSEKSLGRLEACDLLPATVVAAKLGPADTKAMRYPSAHICGWRGAEREDPIVRLYLGDGPSQYRPDFEEVTLAGRTTRIVSAEPGGTSSICDLETEHIFSPDLGEKELAMLEIDLVGKGKDACGPGRELAREVWATLPKG